MMQKFGAVCGDGSLALKFLKVEVLPAVNSGEKIALNCQGVRVMNSSFSNALFGNLVKLAGTGALSKLKVVNAVPSVRQEIKSSTTLGFNYKKSA